jgi:DUF4097 and DUF4098 domain-containing protein YvlB
MGRLGIISTLANANKMKTRLALTSFTLLSFCIPFVGCNLKNYSASRDYQKTIPCDSQIEVEVSSFCGDILITKSDLPEITIVAHMKAYGASQKEAEGTLDSLVPTIESNEKSTQIVVEQKERSTFVSNSVDFEVKVPTGCNLRLTTYNGRISSEDSQASVTASTSNGDVLIFNARGKIELKSSNGELEVKQCDGNLQASTSNGSIGIIGCTLQGDCKAITTNGEIEASLPATTSLLIKAATTNGTVQFPTSNLKTTQKSESAIEGVWGMDSEGRSAPEVSITLESSNGDIVIKEISPAI